MILRPLFQWAAGAVPEIPSEPTWLHLRQSYGWRVFPPRLRALWVETGSTLDDDPTLDTFRW